MKNNSLEYQCISNFELLEQQLGELPNLQPCSNEHFYIPEQLTSLSLNNQINDIYYQTNQDGRLTNSYWGAIATDSDNILKLEKINHLKSNFQTSVIKLRQANQNSWLDLYQKINSRAQATHNQLVESNLTRLHLKQTYRQIPILKSHPSKIAFSWYTSGKSIKKLSRQQVLQRLLALGEDKQHIQMQINLLAQVNDLFFAQVQSQAPTIRANILNNNKHTLSFNCSLPIFFEHNNDLDFPIITELPSQENIQRKRKKRNDIKIEDECFIKSLRIHRYI